MLRLAETFAIMQAYRVTAQPMFDAALSHYWLGDQDGVKRGLLAWLRLCAYSGADRNA